MIGAYNAVSRALFSVRDSSEKKIFMLMEMANHHWSPPANVVEIAMKYAENKSDIFRGLFFTDTNREEWIPIGKDLIPVFLCHDSGKLENILKKKWVENGVIFYAEDAEKLLEIMEWLEKNKKRPPQTPIPAEFLLNPHKKPETMHYQELEQMEDDIIKITPDDWCTQTIPCQHEVVFTFKKRPPGKLLMGAEGIIRLMRKRKLYVPAHFQNAFSKHGLSEPKFITD